MRYRSFVDERRLSIDEEILTVDSNGGRQRKGGVAFCWGSTMERQSDASFRQWMLMVVNGVWAGWA
jgi:hypothetical protein